MQVRCMVSSVSAPFPLGEDRRDLIHKSNVSAAKQKPVIAVQCAAMVLLQHSCNDS